MIFSLIVQADNALILFSNRGRNSTNITWQDISILSWSHGSWIYKLVQKSMVPDNIQKIEINWCDHAIEGQGYSTVILLLDTAIFGIFICKIWILQLCYKIKGLFAQILMNVVPCRIVFTSTWMSMILTW